MNEPLLFIDTPVASNNLNSKKNNKTINSETLSTLIKINNLSKKRKNILCDFKLKKENYVAFFLKLNPDFISIRVEDTNDIKNIKLNDINEIEIIKI